MMFYDKVLIWNMKGRAGSVCVCVCVCDTISNLACVYIYIYINLNIVGVVIIKMSNKYTKKSFHQDRSS
jgi:hypothetical protein